MSSTRIVEFVKASSAALEKAAVMQRQLATFEKASADRSAKIVTALKAAGVIREGENEKAAQVLRDPVHMLTLIENMANAMAKRAAAPAMAPDAALRMGQPAATKSAASVSAFDKCGQAILGRS